jgi:DNA-binding transcriptional LysR family regulator
VSLHIRQLEEKVGLALVERVGKRASPTRAGEILLETRRAGFRRARGGAPGATRFARRGGGRVRVGTGATASIHLLPPVLRRLRARYPAIELVVVTGNSREVASAVAANQLDLAVVTLPVSARALAVEPLRVDSLVAIAPPAGSGAGARAVHARGALAPPADRLRARPAISGRSSTSGSARRAPIPRAAMELGNAEAIKKLVGAGLGLSLASAMAVAAEVKAGVAVRHPAQPTLARRLALIRRRDKPDTPALRVVLAALGTLKPKPRP